MAGFVLKGLGYTGMPMLDGLADIGVILLLFSIGLKLKIGTLLKPEVWAGASLHMAAVIVVFGLAIFGLAAAGVHLFAELDLASSALVAFAFSFSSTVFAVKVLEEKGEMQSMHGRVAIGILIMQDVFAVVFITVSTGKVPSLWALALFGLILVRPLLFRVMDRCGHGELIPLFGLFAALVLGAEAFDVVGLKADLGALILGILLAKHGRAGEISESLLSFKDIFLVGFFLNIGLESALSLEAVLVALLFVLVLPFKVAAHRAAGRNVVLGDATDSDFWERAQQGRFRLVMLTLPEVSASLDVARRLAARSYTGKTTAVSHFPDEAEILERAGVDLAVDIFAEAGAGFAGHVQQQFATELAELAAPDR